MDKELLELLQSHDTEKLDEMIAKSMIDEVDIKQRNEQGQTALLEVSKHKPSSAKLKMINYLLERGYSKLDERDNGGCSALLLAVNSGDESLVRFLLAQPEVSLKEQDHDGYHVLSLAGLCSNLTMLRCLIEKGAYIDMLDNRARKVTDESFWKAGKFLAMVETLLEYSRGQLEELPQNIWQILSGSLNARQIKTGNTALHYAVMNKKTELVKKLLQFHASCIIENHAKETALDLMRKMYADHPYLLALASARALREQDLKRTHEDRMILRKPILKKENKEVVEITELKLSKENEAYFDQCEKIYQQLETLSENLSDEENETVFFSLGILFQNGLSTLYNPARAYEIFSRLSNPKFERHKESHKWVIDLLLEKKVIFEEKGIDGEMVPKNRVLELDNQWTSETEKGRQFRLKETIKYLMYSDTVHNEALKGYIAEYALGASKSIVGIKNFKGKDPDSILALIECLKSQTDCLNQQELENKKLREEIQNLKKLNRKDLKENKEENELLFSRNAFSSSSDLIAPVNSNQLKPEQSNGQSL